MKCEEQKLESHLQVPSLLFFGTVSSVHLPSIEDFQILFLTLHHQTSLLLSASSTRTISGTYFAIPMSIPIWSPYLKANKGSWLSDNSLLLFVQPRPCYLSRQCHLCRHCNQYNAIYADNANCAYNPIYVIHTMPIVHTLPFVQPHSCCLSKQCHLCIQCHLCNPYNAIFGLDIEK